MNLIFKLASVFCTLLFLAIAPPAAIAGPIPFTQNQFPVFYAVQSSPVSITNSGEAQLYQVAVPPAFMGNAGFLSVTLLADGDAGTTNKSLIVYLGGAQTTNATALYTNTYKTTVATPISARIFPYVGGYSNLVYSTIYTNANAGALKQTIVVGSQTNGLYLTVTGTCGDTHGTYMTLGGVIIEALAQ
jgi:hypothetical protein